MLQKRIIFSIGGFVALIAILVYVIVRLSLFIAADYDYIEKTFAVLLLLGEFFILLHAVGYILNILIVIKRPKEFIPETAALKDEPPVAILVAARHEPKQVLENTFITLKNLNYKNKTVYFLDDSSEEEYHREADELARQYDLRLFHRKVRHGAKAGIINDCLKGLTHKYVVIFDADQNPLPDFLKVLIPIMEKDEKLAFIQAPQFYSNREESRVSRAAGFQQDVFYEYICEGKSLTDSMFCCGTNLVFRRQALAEVGGLDESTVTEDFATSLKLHSRGWKSLYYNHVYAFGMGPINLVGYFKQQLRWSTGTIAVLKKLIWKLLTRPFSLRPAQWWEYLLSSSYYLIGSAFFCLMICPVMYLLFKIPSFFVRPEVYFASFLPYFILSLLIFYTLLEERKYKVRDLFSGQLLGLCAFSVYIHGAFSALLGLKATFGITQKTKAKAISYLILWPQLAMIFVNCIAVVWGINRFLYEREPAILINSFWSLYYMLALCSIFYFNEGS